MRFRRKASSEEISGFLDQETAVTGELQFTGTLRIDGTFHGSITTSDILVVGEHAVIHADIKAGEVDIHGRVFGTVEGRRRLQIHATGKVSGDIRTSNLILESGGTFDGRSYMAGETEGTAPSESPADRKAAGASAP